MAAELDGSFYGAWLQGLATVTRLELGRHKVAVSLSLTVGQQALAT